MTLGEELRNPNLKDIAKSERLLLKTISEHGPISEDDVCKRLDQSKEEGFIFMFGMHQPHTLHDELMRYLDLGIIKVKKWEKEEPHYNLTRQGEEVLYQYQSKHHNL